MKTYKISDYFELIHDIIEAKFVMSIYNDLCKLMFKDITKQFNSGRKNKNKKRK